MKKAPTFHSSDMLVFCVRPLWRGDHADQMDVLERFCDSVKKINGNT